MSNAMRTGKRWLAGAAAGALGAGLITFAAAPAAQASVSVTSNGPLRPAAIASNTANADDSTLASITTNAMGQSYETSAAITSLSLLSAPGISIPVGSTLSVLDDSTPFVGSVLGSGITQATASSFDDSGLIVTDAAGLPVKPSAGAQFKYTFGGAAVPTTSAIRVPIFFGVTDDSLVNLVVANAGTYQFLVNGTTSWTVTTTGAAASISLTPTVQSMANIAGQTTEVDLAVLDAGGNVTQLVGSEGLTLTSSDDSTVLSSTGGSEDDTTLTLTDDSMQIGENAITVTLAAGGAGSPAVTLTSAGTALLSGLTRATAVINMTTTATTTAMAVTQPVNAVDTKTTASVSPYTAEVWYVSPGTLSLTFQSTLAAGSTSDKVFYQAYQGQNVLAANLLGAEMVTATSGVSKYTLSLAPSLTAAGQKVTVTDGTKAIVVTFQSASAVFTVTPDASVVAGKIGGSVSWKVGVGTSYGVPLSGYSVKLTTPATSRNPSTSITATTGADGTATLTLPDTSTSVSNVTDAVTITAIKDAVAANYDTPAGATSFTSTVKWTATGDVALTNLRFNNTAAASFTTTQLVPGAGTVATVGTTTAAGWVTVTAVASVPGVPVTFSGPAGSILSDSGSAITITDLSLVEETSLTVASNATTGVATAYYLATKSGTNAVTATSSSGATLSGNLTYSSYTNFARNIALAVSPAKQTTGRATSVTVTVTDVFGNPVPLAGGADTVTLQTNLGSLAGGVSIYSVAATNTLGQATVTLVSEVPGKATVTAAGVGGQFAQLANQPFIPAAAPVKAATAEAEFAGGADKSLVIVGERTTVSGKPGIKVEGTSTGFDAGAAVKPWIRFPGETSYAVGSARPTVSAIGDFSWQRKTGKKTYVYFTSADDAVKSNRVIIAAN